jgi:hypothetical protein
MDVLPANEPYVMPKDELMSQDTTRTMTAPVKTNKAVPTTLKLVGLFAINRDFLKNQKIRGKFVHCLTSQDFPAKHD